MALLPRQGGGGRAGETRGHWELAPLDASSGYACRESWLRPGAAEEGRAPPVTCRRAAGKVTRGRRPSPPPRAAQRARVRGSGPFALAERIGRINLLDMSLNPDPIVTKTHSSSPRHGSSIEQAAAGCLPGRPRRCAGEGQPRAAGELILSRISDQLPASPGATPSPACAPAGRRVRLEASEDR